MRACIGTSVAIIASRS